MKAANTMFALMASGYVWLASVNAHAEEKTANSFLALSEGQRMWFLEGSLRTVSHLVSLSDRKKGQCVSEWYLGSDRAAKRALIERTLAANPERRETTVILSLLTQACGPLLPESVNQ